MRVFLFADDSREDVSFSIVKAESEQGSYCEFKPPDEVCSQLRTCYWTCSTDLCWAVMIKLSHLWSETRSLFHSSTDPMVASMIFGFGKKWHIFTYPRKHRE